MAICSQYTDINFIFPLLCVVCSVNPMVLRQGFPHHDWAKCDWNGWCWDSHSSVSSPDTILFMNNNSNVFSARKVGWGQFAFNLTAGNVFFFLAILIFTKYFWNVLHIHGSCYSSLCWFCLQHTILVWSSTCIIVLLLNSAWISHFLITFSLLGKRSL